MTRVSTPHRDDGVRSREPRALAGVDLNLLVPLRALLEERSVTRAARRVGISQPAMSHALDRCRKLLGDELLVRAGASFEPTPRARPLLEQLRGILGAVDAVLLDGPAFVPACSTRTFRISATSTTALVVLPPLLRRVQQFAPRVSFHTVDWLARGEKLLDLPDVDVALLAEPLPSDLPRERLYDDHWVAVVAFDNPAVGSEVTFEHLTELSHVMFDTSPLRSHLIPYQVLERLGLRYTVRLRVHDFLLAPLVLAGTDLIAVTQERAARAFATAGLVRILPLPFDVPPLGIDMVWNPRGASDVEAVWLREQLMAVVADGPPGIRAMHERDDHN